MSIETKQCSIRVDAPPYRQCLAVGADECAYVVSLRDALREALDGWARWAYPRADEHGSDGVRIAELRKFLDDK